MNGMTCKLLLYVGLGMSRLGMVSKRFSPIPLEFTRDINWTPGVEQLIPIRCSWFSMINLELRLHTRATHMLKILVLGVKSKILDCILCNEFDT